LKCLFKNLGLRSLQRNSERGDDSGMISSLSFRGEEVVVADVKRRFLKETKRGKDRFGEGFDKCGQRFNRLFASSFQCCKGEE